MLKKTALHLFQIRVPGGALGDDVLVCRIVGVCSVCGNARTLKALESVGFASFEAYRQILCETAPRGHIVSADLKSYLVPRMESDTPELVRLFIDPRETTDVAVPRRFLKLPVDFYHALSAGGVKQIGGVFARTQTIQHIPIFVVIGCKVRCNTLAHRYQRSLFLPCNIFYNVQHTFFRHAFGR